MAPQQQQKLAQSRPPARGARVRARLPASLSEQQLASAQWRAMTIALAAAALCLFLLQLRAEP